MSALWGLWIDCWLGYSFMCCNCEMHLPESSLHFMATWITKLQLRLKTKNSAIFFLETKSKGLCVPKSSRAKEYQERKKVKRTNFILWKLDVLLLGSSHMTPLEVVLMMEPQRHSLYFKLNSCWNQLTLLTPHHCQSAIWAWRKAHRIRLATLKQEPPVLAVCYRLDLDFSTLSFWLSFHPVLIGLGSTPGY